MLPEQLATDKPTSQRHRSLDDTIYDIGITLALLDPGPLAQMRRLENDNTEIGAPHFWRLVARHPLVASTPAAWARIIRIMAILTDKGRDDHKASPHDRNRRLGTVLCDGGYPRESWPPPGELVRPRPMLSEDRLARLLTAKGDTRSAAMERTARMLASKKPAGAGVNCNDIARYLIFPEDPNPPRDIARDYYARLDRAGQVRNDTANTHSDGDDR